ncbi:cadherin domain protein [Oesophagostomum dentatum]|uniref:Cadherin domain protein n=1 Tax=Oesophagostomum dentatum TaxID=61180 RepID=A0A0B1SWB7_OESDE|nr:cadherin domain protein [Oesophagostomum dentatum]
MVEDQNDNSPVFDKVIYIAEILENSDAQQLVCVSASDSDLGKNAKISYSIASGNSAEAFTIDSSTGCIKTTRSLDREEISNYRLTVLATDHGVPPLSAMAIVKVEVLDEDDNAPKFSHLFHAEVYEDLKVSLPVLLISATDPDEHDNHTFSIDNETDTPFLIDNRTGQIWLRENLDREKESSYRLRVRVSDGTWTVQTGAAISVLDINDNAPVFEKDQYVFIVNGSRAGQSVGRIHAFDADDGINGVVSYRFEQDVRFLSIDAVSGDVRLLEVADRDVTTAIVTAQDNGVPVMTSTASVTVVFPSKRAPDCEIAVNVGTLNGTRLGRLDDYCSWITDAKESNATRQFFSDHSYVKIDGEGNLLTSRDFPEGTDDVIIDLITELENGSAVLRAVKLEMSQGNKNSPQFVEKIFHFTVSEDLTKGHLVGTVNATDADVGLSGKISYSMQSDRDVPLLIHSNGSIMVSGILDYELKKRYILIAEADFCSAAHFVLFLKIYQDQISASAQVVVDLLDVNDNPPMLEDKDLIYAVTSADDVICPAVSDIDTPNADLEFFIDSSETVTVTHQGCMKINGTVPAVINWTTSDDNQSVTARVKFLDMIPRKPDIRDEDVTISENSVDDTVVASYANAIFAEHSDQLSAESKDIKVKGGRGVHNETRKVYAKAKFGRVLRSSKLTVTSLPVAPSPVFAKPLYTFNISNDAPRNTIIHNFGMTVPADCRLEIVSGNRGNTFCILKNGSLALCGRLRHQRCSIPIEVICGNRTRSRSEILVTVHNTVAKNIPMVSFVRENLASAVIGQLSEEHGKKFSYHIGDKRTRERHLLRRNVRVHERICWHRLLVEGLWHCHRTEAQEKQRKCKEKDDTGARSM